MFLKIKYWNIFFPFLERAIEILISLYDLRSSILELQKISFSDYIDQDKIDIICILQFNTF